MGIETTITEAERNEHIRMAEHFLSINKLKTAADCYDRADSSVGIRKIQNAVEKISNYNIRKKLTAYVLRIINKKRYGQRSFV